MNISVTHIDTACILLEIGGYRIVTDPTLDNRGARGEGKDPFRQFQRDGVCECQIWLL